MKKTSLFKCIAAMGVLLGTSSAVNAQATSGTCGTTYADCHWEYDTVTTTLTISGTGAMSTSRFGWELYRETMTSAVIDSGVTSISSRSFYGHTKLTIITIPSSVTSIGDDAFDYCSGLTAINVDTTNVNYSSQDGILYNKNKTEFLLIPPSISGNVTIPGSITTIGNSAFFSCTGLTSITIPNSVTSIGNSAFFSCTGLTSITIPNSVTSIGIGAFVSCNGLTSVTIPNSVTSIGENAFQGCTGLTSITIPNSVTSIGNYAFANCSGLTAINVDTDNVNYSSQDSILYNKNKTQIIQIPQRISGNITIPNSITSIGVNAFRDCTELTSITIPNSVISIGNYAFRGCTGLTNIIIPNSVTSIGDNAFYGCTGLTNITLPNSVTTIGNSAFRGCTGLTSITIPNSVTSIDNYAFSGCTGLTNITIPNSVTTIGNYAFAGCTGLQTVYNMCSAPQTIAASVFNDVARGSVDLYVPSASVSAYRSAVVWKDFRVICIGCVSVTGVSVSPTTLSLKPDATQQLTATLTPDSATNKNVTWSSSNTSVASVDTNGNVTAVSAGTATITVTTDDNSKTATCVVTVSAATGVAAVELRKLQAYPNPIVNGELIIANGQLNVGDKIEIYNVNGVLVETHCRASLQGGTTINIGHLPAGIYIVKVAGRAAKVVK